MSHVHDPGLRAVARVRDVRERDSRIGLQQALRTTERREAEAAAAQQRLDSAPPFTSGTSAQFHAARVSLAALATEARRRREAAEASRATTDEARRRWQHDRTRLRAVDSLLDRRAQARQAELTRKETIELDDVAARMWLRRRGHTTPDAGGAA